jgi:hypothetical protein
MLIRLLNGVRACALAHPLVFCMDGFNAYIGAIRFVFCAALLSGKQSGRMEGMLRRFFQCRETAVQRLITQNGDGKLLFNTAFFERLKATFQALTCQAVTMQSGVYLIGMVYHFCTEHPSLRLKLWEGKHGFLQ